MRKLKSDDIVAKMKEGIKSVKKVAKSSPIIDCKIESKRYSERDMRKEAIDMGSHQAKEYFGSPDDGKH